MASKTIIIASDHAGFGLKSALCDFLTEKQVEVHDLGTHSTDSVDYPDFGYALADAVSQQDDALGIAICGTGIGISIAANRHTKMRAAVCHDGLSAELSRRHNNANVLALGARLIGEDTAKECVLRFLNTEFEGGRHEARVEKLTNPTL